MHPDLKLVGEAYLADFLSFVVDISSFRSTYIYTPVYILPQPCTNVALGRPPVSQPLS